MVFGFVFREVLGGQSDLKWEEILRLESERAPGSDGVPAEFLIDPGRSSLSQEP